MTAQAVSSPALAAHRLCRLSEAPQGLGAQLLRGLVDLARTLGYPALYCATATATARSLLERESWQLLEETVQDERRIFIFAYRLGT